MRLKARATSFCISLLAVAAALPGLVSGQAEATDADMSTVSPISDTAVQPVTESIPSIEDTLTEEPRAAGIAEPGELVFEEIELTPDGVQAQDTSGRGWVYDFEEDVFVLDSLAGSDRNLGPDELNAEEWVQPHEVRCTEELTLPETATKDVFVGFDEFVEGDIQAYGRVTVKGWVRGGIRSLGDRVLVTATGRVDGDIRAPEISIKEGAIILGDTSTVNLVPVDIRSFSAAGITIVLAVTLFLLVVAFLWSALASRQMAVMESCISRYRWKTYFLGLLALCLLPLGLILLVLTVVGILVVPVVAWVALPVALTTGMAASSRVMLGLVARKQEPHTRSPFFHMFVGVLIFMALWAIVAMLLGSADGVAVGIGVFALVVAILATTYPLLAGLGAAVLTRFGFRPYVPIVPNARRDDIMAPAPPPMPTTPLGPPPVSAPTLDRAPLRRPQPPRREE